MTTLSWASALDAWEAFLDELEHALEGEAWDERDSEPMWSVPGDIPGEPTEAEERRALELADRAGRLRERLEAAMLATTGELGDERRKAVGVNAYRRQNRRDQRS